MQTEQSSSQLVPDLSLWMKLFGEIHSLIWTNTFYILPVEAVSKSMAMMSFPFFSKLLHHRSQWQKPTLPRLLDRGLQNRSKLFRLLHFWNYSNEMPSHVRKSDQFFSLSIFSCFDEEKPTWVWMRPLWGQQLVPCSRLLVC